MSRAESLSVRIFSSPIGTPCVICLFLVLASLACATFSETLSAAEADCGFPVQAPLLRPGDSWNLESTTGRTWRRHYVAQAPDGLLEAKWRDGARAFYDQTHTLRRVQRGDAVISNPSPGFYDSILVFPLEAGKGWSGDPIFAAATTYRMLYSVRGCERVSVPAGTFTAVVIDQQVTYHRTEAQLSYTLWYAPEIKYFVKRVQGRRLAFNLEPDWELVAYSIDNGARAFSARVAGPADAASVSSSGDPAPPLTLPPANLPVWERGYEWKYRWFRGDDTGIFVDTVIGEQDINGKAHYVVAAGANRSFYTKDALTLYGTESRGRLRTKYAPPNPILTWPLDVGKEWDANYTREDLETGRTQDVILRRKVEAVETTRTPAGAFAAFHIRSRNRAGEVRSELWFSPEAKRFTRQWYFEGRARVEHVLLDYRLKPTLAPAAEASGR